MKKKGIAVHVRLAENRDRRSVSETLTDFTKGQFQTVARRKMSLPIQLYRL